MQISQRVIGHSVLSGWVRAVCQTVRGYGVSPEALLTQAGLDARFLHTPNARYEVDKVRRFWQLAIQATADPLLGLRMGQEMQASSLSGLGLAMMSSASLAELLMLFARYGKVISTTLQLSLAHDGANTTLILKTQSGSEPMAAARLALTAYLYRQACALSQHPIYPSFVTSSLPAAEYSRRVDDYFHRPVNFGAEYDSIAFRYGDTIEPYAGANAQLLHLNEVFIKNYLAQLQQNDFREQVITHIQALLKKGEPKLQDVAQLMHLTPRTLQRRLKEEHCTFNDLLDNERRHLAHELLVHSECSITEISFLLGFSDPSNFNRAVKRWFKTSPQRHRQRNWKLLG